MATRIALLVVDTQEFFRPMTTTCLSNILTLTKHFSKSSLPIIFTQHGHGAEELRPNPSPNQLVRKWGPTTSIKIGSDDWQLMEEFKPFLPKNGKREKKWVIPTKIYDAFLAPSFVEKSKPSLLGFLEQEKIERVVVCGVMTDCCVDTTCRGACNRGCEIWVVSDACGSANNAQHQAGLRGFEFGFGELLETARVVERLHSES